MKVLFSMGHDGFIRNTESALRLLARDGAEVHLAFSGRRPALMSALMSEAESVDALSAEYPNITYSRAPKGRDGDFAQLAEAIYSTRDYLRYLRPEFREAVKLRERAREHAPHLAQRLADSPLLRVPGVVAVLDRVLRALVPVMPTSPEVDAYLAEHRPDVVLFTPLIGFGSSQNALLRSAKAAGLRTALLVHSWDNLTNKGMIHELPDRVIVWNEAQRREAVELQGIPADRVAVTGAQSYDHWFDWEPSSTREDFCRAVGLDPARPYLLYLCSSSFIAPEEASFVRTWIGQVRENPALRDVGILVRPHPQHVDQWKDSPLADLEGTAVWPPPEGDADAFSSRAHYYDSIYHCQAVAGVNTSALIESAIVGRPVFTVLAPEFRDTQTGTLHFAHLTSGEGPGFLSVARSFDEHAGQLAKSFDGNGGAAERAREFVETFVRPHGVAEPAAPRVAQAIADLARSPAPGTEPRRRWHEGARQALAPLARRARAADEEARRARKAKKAAAA